MSWYYEAKLPDGLCACGLAFFRSRIAIASGIFGFPATRDDLRKFLSLLCKADALPPRAAYGAPDVGPGRVLWLAQGTGLLLLGRLGDVLLQSPIARQMA
jgi:hypothetical protein